jgi:hypothetical protein
LSDGNEKNGTGDSKPDNPDDWEVRHKAGQRRMGKPALLPGVQTPEQGCITCLSGVLILVLSLAFWGYIYWLYNPEFHHDQSGATPTPKATKSAGIPPKK